jgi:hypothetical protein
MSLIISVSYLSVSSSSSSSSLSCSLSHLPPCSATQWIEKNRQLEKDLDWAREMADRLQRFNQELTKENSRLKMQARSFVCGVCGVWRVRARGVLVVDLTEWGRA